MGTAPQRNRGRDRILSLCVAWLDPETGRFKMDAVGGEDFEPCAEEAAGLEGWPGWG